MIPDTATSLSMFESGEFDLVDIPSNLFKTYQEKHKDRVKLFYNGAFDWLKINMRPNSKKPWLTNQNFRSLYPPAPVPANGE